MINKLKNAKTITILVMVGLVFFVAVFAPFLTPQDPYYTDFTRSNTAPSAEHWAGTDSLGRDIFSRLILGTQASVLSALALIILTTTVGVCLGMFAGYNGGRVDTFIMRIVDTMLSFPDLVLALAIIGIFGTGLLPAMVAIFAVKWAKYARLTRSLVMKIKTQNYLIAAITNGTKPHKIVFSHVFPNIIPQIFVAASLDIGSMILLLSSLSFLGFGILPPTPEWGYMLSEARGSFLTAPHLIFAPGVTMLIVVIIFNLFGDSMRDVFDTKSN
ncbi:nickel transporter permease [Vibrio sp. WXL103]|uniref:nickel transporter permease n=1 Tax=unclassified Vibrio TaxID=2614977 RepID=UPI003EC913A4